MRRRRFVRIAVAGVAWFALSGHTPYGHWSVYRQKHLLIGSSRTDPPSFALAERIAATLARHLPESRARASRAPDLLRVASLLASDQWQVSVVRRRDAIDIAGGRGPFASVGAVPLRILFEMSEHVLVCPLDFPDRHAWLITATLAENADELPGATALETADSAIPMHPGARAYAKGAPLPPAPADAGPAAADPEHGHPH